MDTDKMVKVPKVSFIRSFLSLIWYFDYCRRNEIGFVYDVTDPFRPWGVGQFIYNNTEWPNCGWGLTLGEALRNYEEKERLFEEELHNG